MIGPIPYIGGKRRLARSLLRLIPDHIAYVEVFCGGAQLFFHKDPSRVEVLNDLDGQVINFLRVCRHHAEELVRSFRFLVASRSLFAQFAAQNPADLTDVQQAVRFLYVQKNGFGGQILRPAFHYGVTKPSNFNPARLPAIIAKTAARLQRVQLENLPYEQILTRYDRPTTFFYLDPPYVSAKLYRFNFSDQDFGVLAQRLAQIRGRFLLSINDCHIARTAFRSFRVRECSVVYTASRNVPTARELLISNYPLPEEPTLIGGSITSTDT